jgi:hypothetical protein
MSAPAIRGLPLYKRGRTLTETIEAYSMPVPECGCWIWMGAAGRYGQAKRNGRVIRAHRLSWIAHNGDIPAGLHVLHKCDTPLCVNPAHLFIGTPLDNAGDREAKGRGNQPSGLRNGRHTKPWRTARGERHYCYMHPEFRQGEKNGRAKLTESDIVAIRSSTLGPCATGRLFGVSKTTIMRIRDRRLWSHIE